MEPQRLLHTEIFADRADPRPDRRVGAEVMDA
jgi:hypothetical protein